MKIPVGILGATVMVGQQYLKLLENHPWFVPVYLAASEKSSGKSLREAIQGRCLYCLSEEVLDLEVHPMGDFAAPCAFFFSALESSAAMQWEAEYAKAGFPVLSNASAHRKDEDIPVLIPEINADHLSILPLQQKRRGWKKGFIVVKPNCSLQSYLAPLYALHTHFPVSQVIVSTLQAISGAGWPGIASLDIVDNIIPFIPGEEEKSEQEPCKILGRVEGEKIIASQEISFSAHCNRVPVIEGHMACVSLGFLEKKPSFDEVRHLWKTFGNTLSLPSSPKQCILYREEENRPQSRLDKEAGMSITVGRLRACPVLDMRFVGLSHNTVRGAAGGGILNAELLKARGYLG